MMRELDVRLINKLPIDVIINHIIPYTYSTHSQEHLEDIRNYALDTNCLFNFFYANYNPFMLLYDIVCFCNGKDLSIYGVQPQFIIVMKRSYKLSLITNKEIDCFIYSSLCKNKANNVDRKIKLLWGILTPRERTAFINLYIDD